MHRKDGKVLLNEKIESKKRIELLRFNKQLLFRWIRRNQAGRPISNFFHENYLKSVALYYWNEMSELLYYELINADIQVAGVIDNRADLETLAFRYSSINDIDDVDAVIICTAMDVSQIEEELRKQKHCLILTIDDLL